MAAGKSLAEIALERYAEDPESPGAQWAIARFLGIAGGIPPDCVPAVNMDLPRRGDRRMPRMWKIALHWHEHPEIFGPLDLSAVPFCFRCLREVTTGRWPHPRDTWTAAGMSLDRAHLIDRWADGLDGPQNTVPLCVLCHAAMPAFRAGEEDKAVAWVLAGRGRRLWRPRADQAGDSRAFSPS